MTMDIPTMRERDMARRDAKRARARDARQAAPVKFDAFAEALRAEARRQRVEVDRQFRVQVDGRRALSARVAEVKAWLASDRLAPEDRSAYERELRGLAIERGKTDRELDRLGGLRRGRAS